MIQTGYKLLTYCTLFIWASAGLLTFGSTYYGFNALNFIIGGLFVIIGYFFYDKYKINTSLLLEFKSTSTLNTIFIKTLNRFLIQEFIVLLVGFLLGLVVGSGAYSRVFGEEKSVFGLNTTLKISSIKA